MKIPPMVLHVDIFWNHAVLTYGSSFCKQWVKREMISCVIMFMLSSVALELMCKFIFPMSDTCI